MSNNKQTKPVAAVIGAALAGSVIVQPALAAENPFGLTDLDQGYQLTMSKKPEEGKCGEGKCGDDKKASSEGKCGEGKCGDDKAKSSSEGKCGQGVCGGNK